MCDLKPAGSKLGKTSGRQRLSIDYCNWTLNLSLLRSRLGTKLFSNTLFSKTPAQFLGNKKNDNNSNVRQRWCNISAGFVQNSFLQRFFLGWKLSTLLIVRKKMMYPFFSTIVTKWSHLKHYLGEKTLSLVKSLLKK